MRVYSEGEDERMGLPRFNTRTAAALLCLIGLKIGGEKNLRVII